MKFSGIVVALAGNAPFVTADLHTRPQYLNTEGRGPAGSGTAGTNDPATIAACNAYRNRNSGSQKWDTCPDCTVVQHNQVKVCQSLGWHLGGDEFLYYCEQNGANASA